MVIIVTVLTVKLSEEISMLSTLVEISTIITNLFLSIGVIIAVFQLIQMKKGNTIQFRSIKADHERKKSNQQSNFTTKFIRT